MQTLYNDSATTSARTIANFRASQLSQPSQWNADGLSPKVHELRQRLQLETKLISKTPTPVFPGFSAMTTPPLLKAYANLLDTSADPLCTLCKEKPQTIDIWLRRCPRFDATRQNVFGSPSPPLKILTTEPERVQAHARVTLG